MKYDPIKRKLGVVFNKTPFLRKLFYNLAVMPFVLVLNYFDVTSKHKTGTGVIAKAWK